MDSEFDLSLLRGLIDEDISDEHYLSFSEKIKAQYKQGLEDDSDPLLHQCAKQNDVATAEWLIEQGYPIGKGNSNGELAIHVCFTHSSVPATDFINFLLKAKDTPKYINYRNSEGKSPLFLAIQKKLSCDIIVNMLKIGADPRICNESGISILHWCCQVGGAHKQYVRIILTDILVLSKERNEEVESRKYVIEQEDFEGQTPLYHAVLKQKKEMVELLLQHGASSNTTDRNSNSLIHAAFENKPGTKQFAHILQLLIQRGVSLNIQNCNGQTALHRAVQQGSASHVKTLLKAGADVGLKDTYGNTVLHAAMNSRSTPFISELLSHPDISINARNVYGATALHIAVESTSHHVYDLIKAGSDLSIKNNLGKTVLDVVFERSNSYISHVLCKYPPGLYCRQNEEGGDINMQNVDGYTLLHYACSNENLELVQYLLQKGASVNIRSRQGVYPLSCFVHSKLMTLLTWDTDDVEIIKLLVNSGTKINDCERSQDTKHPSSLMHELLSHVRIPEGYPFYLLQSVIFLVNNGLKVNMIGDENKTPFLSLSTFIGSSLARRNDPFSNLTCIYDMIRIRDGMKILLSAGSFEENLKAKHSVQLIDFEKYIILEKEKEFVDLLIEFGYIFNPLNFVDSDEDLEPSVFSQTDWVPRLKDLASAAIRRHLQPNSWVGVAKLPAPNYIKSYICLYRNDLCAKYNTNEIT